MEHEQVPTDRPRLKIALRLDPLEVGEKTRGKRVDRQDTKRKNANMHESTVYHWGLSPHPCAGRIFKGLCTAVAASGLRLSRGLEPLKVTTVLLHPSFVTIDYDCLASNGTPVPKREHCTRLCSIMLAAETVMGSTRAVSKVFGPLAFAARISYHNFLVIEQTGQP